MLCPEVSSSPHPLTNIMITTIQGYYDAGDLVKFGFPMAATITVLAWGGVNFMVGQRIK